MPLEQQPSAGPQTTGPKISRSRFLRGPLLVFVAGLVVFGAVSGNRLRSHSRDNHYVYLADAMLHGRLHIEGKPPHRNDWARYGDRWFVSFPPAPAVLMIPVVAVLGLETNDRIFSLLFAAAGPALLFTLLSLLVARGRLGRRPWELYLLSALYGVGTVYFFSAVQGSVWYTAHMVGGVLLLLYLISSLDGRHPLWAGLFLGLAFATRPPMLLAFPFFLYEMLQPHWQDDPSSFVGRLLATLKSIGTGPLVRRLALFGLPLVLILVAMMLMNWARFEDPLEFGHRHLQVRWSGRIERWGLFHYHYLARNLAVALALLPWLSAKAPFLGVSRHGLAIWFTTPTFLYALWPTTRTGFYRLLVLSTILVAVPSLLYQNSGWIQFGYRFSLDYTVFLILMLAVGGRRFGKQFLATCLFALVVNSFGAITFDRNWELYPSASTKSYFQPD